MITIKKEYFLTSTDFSSNVFKMIYRDFQSMLWVSNMILMTRVTQRNKLWVRTTLQSVFTDGNESSCWFFQFDALSKSKFWVGQNAKNSHKLTFTGESWAKKPFFDIFVFLFLKTTVRPFKRRVGRLHTTPRQKKRVKVENVQKGVPEGPFDMRVSI